ncbi:MAG TPA: TIGR03790 family protein [Steroidobacteraceae bacterium]
MNRLIALLAALALTGPAGSEGLNAGTLGVFYNLDESSSREIAQYYAARRAIPAANVIGIHMGTAGVLDAQAFSSIRKQAMAQLPDAVQSLALVWSKPYAAGCMSITTAFAAGYRPEFCAPGCEATAPSPLFDTDGWLPADTVGWWPAMLIPTADIAGARALIDRGIAADAGNPPGILYLARTADKARNVRAASYQDIESTIGARLRIVELSAPVTSEVPRAIGYFTGASQVEELERIQFLPGAVADHLTSAGGVLYGGNQMSALEWLKQGATAAYGTVSEPCNHLEKFPSINVLMHHYLHGETILEAYWKSVAMPGQGLFIGEPLSAPFRVRRASAR